MPAGPVLVGLGQRAGDPLLQQLIGQTEAPHPLLVKAVALLDVGMLLDYFAASPDELAMLDLDWGPASVDWPHVDCRGMIDGIAGLTAELTGRSPVDLGRERQLTGGTEGPWLIRVPSAVGAALAKVPDERIHSYAEEEILDEEELTRCLQLRDLARAAIISGRDLYGWSCV